MFTVPHKSLSVVHIGSELSDNLNIIIILDPLLMDSIVFMHNCQCLIVLFWLVLVQHSAYSS